MSPSAWQSSRQRSQPFRSSPTYSPVTHVGSTHTRAARQGGPSTSAAVSRSRCTSPLRAAGSSGIIPEHWPRRSRRRPAAIRSPDVASATRRAAARFRRRSERREGAGRANCFRRQPHRLRRRAQRRIGGTDPPSAQVGKLNGHGPSFCRDLRGHSGTLARARVDGDS
jgi:hypothetical protein